MKLILIVSKEVWGGVAVCSHHQIYLFDINVRVKIPRPYPNFNLI